MAYILFLLALVGGLLTSERFYRKWMRHASFVAAKEQYGCQLLRRYPHWDHWWGLDLYQQRAKAAQLGQLMRLYMSHFALYGKTYEEQFFDTRVINTMEAPNIQQVAALSFQDWGKVSSRSNSASPFLGRGIFSEDGAFWKHSRDLIKPTFARSEISDFILLGVYVDRFFDLIPKDGNTFDIQPMLHKLVRDELAI
ncbi:MAG: hypothetical protein LQ351_004833 [Letrouitia transgressa]|nr:MAG: hypothetical protein LQ351_004833 [Letrouitia transgressa]